MFHYQFQMIQTLESLPLLQCSENWQVSWIVRKVLLCAHGNIYDGLYSNCVLHCFRVCKNGLRIQEIFFQLSDINWHEDYCVHFGNLTFLELVFHLIQFKMWFDWYFQARIFSAICIYSTTFITTKRGDFQIKLLSKVVMSYRVKIQENYTGFLFLTSFMCNICL